MSRKFDKILNTIILICAAFAFICYVFYLIGGTAHSDFGGIFVTVFIFLITTLPIIFRKFIKRITKKLYNPLKIFYGACLLLYTIVFIVFSVMILSYSNAEPTFDSRQTVVVVCGSKVNGYEPGEALKKRLDAAYEILLMDDDALCILSGGQGEDETIPEAECMRAYLEAKGIEAERLIKEDKSRNTDENIEYSIKVMEENDISLESNFIFVSSRFHIPRVLMIAAEHGLSAQGAGAVTPFSVYSISRLVRELMSYLFHFIFR